MVWERETHTVAELCAMTKFTKKFAWSPITLVGGEERVWLQSYYIRWYYSGCDFCWKEGIVDTFEGFQESKYRGKEFMEHYTNGGIHRYPKIVKLFKSIKLAIKTFKVRG